MTQEETKKRLEEMEEDARANDPELYKAMQLVKKLTPEERKELAGHLEREIERREAAGA